MFVKKRGGDRGSDEKWMWKILILGRVMSWISALAFLDAATGRSDQGAEQDVGEVHDKDA